MLRPGAERIARLGGLHQFMHWDEADPHRFRRLPGDVAGEAQAHRRAGRHLPVAYRRRHRRADAGAGHRGAMPARRRHPDGARRMHAVSGHARRGQDLARAFAPLGRALARPPSLPAPRRARLCSASCRAASIPICREHSARALLEIGFDGYAIGGLAVGEGQGAMLDMVEVATAILPAGPAALSDGRRHARRSAAVDCARHRHVRLRDADPLRPPLPGLHLGRHGSICAMPAMPTTRRRSIPKAPVPPRDTSGPICIIWCARARRSAPCCSATPMSSSIRS